MCKQNHSGDTKQWAHIQRAQSRGQGRQLKGQFDPRQEDKEPRQHAHSTHSKRSPQHRPAHPDMLPMFTPHPPAHHLGHPNTLAPHAHPGSPAALSVCTVEASLLFASSRKPQAPIQDTMALRTHLSICWLSSVSPQSGEVPWLDCGPSHQQ